MSTRTEYTRKSNIGCVNMLRELCGHYCEEECIDG